MAVDATHQWRPLLHKNVSVELLRRPASLLRASRCVTHRLRLREKLWTTVMNQQRTFLRHPKLSSRDTWIGVTRDASKLSVTFQRPPSTWTKREILVQEQNVKTFFPSNFLSSKKFYKKIADWGAFVKMSKCPIARFVRLSDFHSSYLVSETMTDIPNVAKLSAGAGADARQHRSSFPGLSKM